MKIVLPLIFSVALGLGYFSVVVPWLEMNDERFVLIESRIDMLEKTLLKMQKDLTAQGARIEDLALAPAAMAPEISDEAEAKEIGSSDHGAAVPSERSSIEVAASLSMIEGLVVLTDSERSAVKDALAAAQGEDLEDEVLERVFGAEKFSAFQKERAAFEEKVREESIDRELFALKSSLVLNSEQERAFRDAIAESRARYSVRRGTPQWENMPKGEKERAKYKLLQEELRQEFLLSQAKSILTESQYNSYLEQQATSVSRRSHTSFLQSLSNESEGGASAATPQQSPSAQLP